jgi:hypothetical protein
MNDRTLFKATLGLIFLPILIVAGCDERFRYPCQNPDNWDKAFCKMPACDVTRTCPEHIFKGQRDPRLGPPKDGQTQTPTSPTPSASFSPTTQGVNCGK